MNNDYSELDPNKIPVNKMTEKIEKQFSSIKGIFDNQFNSKLASENNKKKSKQKDFDPKKTKGLDSSDLKEKKWETVKSYKNKEKDNYDGREILRSNSEIENNYGGTGLLNSENNKYKEMEEKLRRKVLKDSKTKRDERENRKKMSPEAREEWEQVSVAKKTSDVFAGNMGFTPNRSSYEPAKLPDVKINGLNKIKELNNKNAKNGKQAAEIKQQLDKKLFDIFDLKMKEQYNWEEEALEEIHHNVNKKIDISQPDKFAKEFVPVKKTSDNPLNGLFATPEDPKEVKEKKIKRDSSGIKEQIKTRKDDRSWEKLKPSKKY
jgi:hypothetical protein